MNSWRISFENTTFPGIPQAAEILALPSLVRRCLFEEGVPKHSSIGAILPIQIFLYSAQKDVLYSCASGLTPAASLGSIALAGT